CARVSYSSWHNFDYW
nr:immunoglobulin heavy chain junction region [Macaca mulatta]MOW22590.1 immunoglobulin heavy chain junction region [Macaca mulatta]MOW22618.1 immunoglobulin heavy chain junction region [Macaca mulatta]MOW22682.1 immunoglobulin heavy chain junction region [Macaca mulatta]MOW22715.1 immunoglobulin heavy chain junction region [Macaca mulatta]